MAGPIQTIPQGLLGLLQLKELGKNPPVLVDSVAPNLDLFQLYMQRQLNGAVGLFGANITTLALVNGNHGFQGLQFGGTTCIVPSNEMWFVYEWCIDIANVAAADSISGGACVFTPQGRSILVSPVYADVISARVRSWITPPLTNQFFAAPGTTFGLYVTDIVTATSITANSEMRAVRILI